jgi:hypothetical protein
MNKLCYFYPISQDQSKNIHIILLHILWSVWGIEETENKMQMIRWLIKIYTLSSLMVPLNGLNVLGNISDIQKKNTE